MKHTSLCALAAVAALTLPTACFERPTNGDLDGHWQIMSVETISGQSYLPVRRYINFYRTTTTLTAYGNTRVGGNLIYREDVDSIILDFPDPGIWLGYWGVPENTPSELKFRIIELTRKRLVMLRDDTVTFTLRKF